MLDKLYGEILCCVLFCFFDYGFYSATAVLAKAIIQKHNFLGGAKDAPLLPTENSNWIFIILLN